MEKGKGWGYSRGDYDSSTRKRKCGWEWSEVGKVSQAVKQRGQGGNKIF